MYGPARTHQLLQEGWLGRQDASRPHPEPLHGLTGMYTNVSVYDAQPMSEQTTAGVFSPARGKNPVHRLNPPGDLHRGSREQGPPTDVAVQESGLSSSSFGAKALYSDVPLAFQYSILCSIR